MDPLIVWVSALRALLVFVALVAAPTTAFSQNTERELFELVRTRAQHSTAQDHTNADLRHVELMSLKGELGVRNVHPAAAHLIYEARVALGAGDPERAATLAKQATELAPDLLAAHWMRVRTELEKPQLSLDLLSGAFQGAARASGRFSNTVVAAANLTAVFAAAFLGSIAAFALLQLLKHGPHLGGDLAIGRLDATYALILFAVLLGLALLAGLGVLLALACLFGVLYPYQSTPERRTSACMVLALAASPFVLHAVTPLFMYPGSPAEAVDTATTQAFARNAEAKLRAHDDTFRSGHPALLAALGERARLRGEREAARTYYHRALKSDPQLYRVRNNLAVVLAQLGDKTAAAEELRAAARDRNLSEAALNLVAIERGGALRACEPRLPGLWRLIYAVDPGERRALEASLLQRAAGNTPALVITVLAIVCLLHGMLRARVLRTERAERMSGVLPAPLLRTTFSLFPGLNAMLEERPARGASLFFLFTFALAEMYWFDGLMRGPHAVVTEAPSAELKILLVANLVVVLIIFSTRQGAKAVE